MKRTKFLAILLMGATLLSACQRPIATTDGQTVDHTTQAPPPADTTTSVEETEPLPRPQTPPYDPETSAPTVLITYRAQDGGKLSGNTNQVLTPDRTACSTVRAIPELGYRFAGWSDGIQTSTRSGDSFAEDTEIIAYFQQDLLNLPAVSITLGVDPDRMNTDQYEEGIISISGCADAYQLTDFATEIRGRGHGSWTYEKKGWKLKLSKGKKLLGLGSGKSREWVLIANHIDRSLLRNAAANWIQHRLELDYIADYAFVDLYLNGEYMGVYQLCEQIEADEHKVPIEMGSIEDVGFLAELTVHADFYRFTVHSDPYEICSDLPYPDQRAYVEAVDAYLTACLVAVKAGNYEEINELIDLDSVVNAYIVEELTKNRDTGWDSFYLYRNPGGKLTFGPLWDFDMSSGNVMADDTSVCRHTFQYPDGLYAGNVATAGDRQQNVWFIEFAKQDWFWELVMQRWQEVYPQLTQLPDLLRQTGDRYEDAFERNFQRWDIFHERLSTEAPVILTMDSCQQQISYLADWYRQRIAWLNGQWGE